MKKALLLLLALVLLPLGVSSAQVALSERPHWSVARNDSTALAPDPARTPEAVIQVYAARLWGWRGALGVHSWIAFKPAGAATYERYEVVRWSNPVVRQRQGQPDTRWAGNEPELLLDRRGAEAARLIPQIRAAIASYPHADEYVIWPGPNSNSFIAHIVHAVPELGARMPSNAVGRDFPAGVWNVEWLSGTRDLRGSIAGLIGFSAGASGVELQFMGLVAGLDFRQPGLIVPAFGRIDLWPV